MLRIGEPPDASKVRVFGPGVEHGVLYSFESTFLVETHGAGAGQLAVRVRGPRGMDICLGIFFGPSPSFQWDVINDTFKGEYACVSLAASRWTCCCVCLRCTCLCVSQVDVRVS